jgi:hypothetical protein
MSLLKCKLNFLLLPIPVHFLLLRFGRNIIILTILWSLQRSSLPIQPSFGPSVVRCVSCQLLSHSWYTDLDNGLYHLPELQLGLTKGVTGWRGMLTLLRQLITPLVYPEVRVCPIFTFVCPTGLMRLMTVLYSCYFIILMVRLFKLVEVWTYEFI